MRDGPICRGFEFSTKAALGAFSKLPPQPKPGLNHTFEMLIKRQVWPLRAPMADVAANGSFWGP